jgi:hypothetical protein
MKELFKMDNNNQNDIIINHEKYLIEMLTLTLQSAYLKDRNALNVIFVAPPGIGKSSLLINAKDLDYVSYANDMTPKYLVQMLKQVDEGKIKFLVIPDYTIMTSGHAEHTRATYQGILRDGMEGGITNLESYQLEFKSKTGRTRFGLITAITAESFNENRYLWRATGFLSRLLPFSYSHTPDTINKINNNIESKKPFLNFKINVNKKIKTINSNPKLLNQLRLYEIILAKEAGSLPYRQVIQLNTLAESACAYRGGTKLEQKDIDKVISLCTYINHEMRGI